MIPYLVTFTLSGALSACAGLVQRKYRVIGIVLLLVSLLPLCFLAGARANFIGTDLSIYGEIDYVRARTVPFLDFINGPLYGILYDAVVWLSINLTGNSHFCYYFTLQALVVLPTTLTFWRIDKKYAWIGVVVYSCIFFGYSLNLMKQLIAIAFVVLSYLAIRRRNIWLFLLCIVIALGFHITAILGLILFPFLIPLKNQDKKTLRTKRIFQIAVIVFAGIMVCTGAAWLPILSSIKNTYAEQVSLMAYAASSPAEFFAKPSYVLFLVALIVLIAAATLVIIRQFKEATDKHAVKSHFADDDELVSLILVMVLGLVLCGLVLISPQLYRVGLYYLVFGCIFCILLVKRIRSRRLRTGLKVLIVCLSAIAFICIFVIGGSCEIYPYYFSHM